MTISVLPAKKLALVVLLFPALQACAPTANTELSAVADAYNTSGVVSTQPYTRTIFSSHNF